MKQPVLKVFAPHARVLLFLFRRLPLLSPSSPSSSPSIRPLSDFLSVERQSGCRQRVDSPSQPSRHRSLSSAGDFGRLASSHPSGGPRSYAGRPWSFIDDKNSNKTILRVCAVVQPPSTIHRFQNEVLNDTVRFFDLDVILRRQSACGCCKRDI